MHDALSVYAVCVVVLFLKMLAVSCYQGYYRLCYKALSATNNLKLKQSQSRSVTHHQLRPKVIVDQLDIVVPQAAHR